MRWLKTLFYLLFPLTMVIAVSFLLQQVQNKEGVQPNSGYQLNNSWPQLPAGTALGNPAGLGIDTSQNIVVLHRADKTWPLVGSFSNELIKENTVLIIDNKSGNLLQSWGSNLFVMPHGLTVDHENNIWITDIGLQQIFKFTHDGKLLMKIGEAGVANNDKSHFNKPTDIAVAKDGSFFVSDGYGNNRIIRFSSKGEYLSEWGTKGDGAGELMIPHALCLVNNHLYVADRENERVQVFDTNGKLVKMLDQLSGADICSVTYDSAANKLYIIDELSFMQLKHRGSDIIIADTSGKVLNRFGRSSEDQSPARWYHDIVTDKQQNIFVGDILNNRILKFEKVASQ